MTDVTTKHWVKCPHCPARFGGNSSVRAEEWLKNHIYYRHEWAP